MFMTLKTGVMIFKFSFFITGYMKSIYLAHLFVNYTPSFSVSPELCISIFSYHCQFWVFG